MGSQDCRQELRRQFRATCSRDGWWITFGALLWSALLSPPSLLLSTSVFPCLWALGPGGSWGPVLEVSWGFLWGMRGLLGALLWKARGLPVSVALSELEKCLLMPSWKLLGTLTEAFWAVLEFFWGSFGPVFGDLGAILRPHEPIRSEKAQLQTIEIPWGCRKMLAFSGHPSKALEQSWGRLRAPCRHAGNHLEQSWGLWCFLERCLGLV